MRSLFIVPLLVALPASAEQPLSPLETARTLSTEGPLYAFDMEFKSKEVTALGNVDPTQPEGRRITVNSPAKEDWPDGFEQGLKEMDAEADGDIWCADMLKVVPDDAELIADENGIARYTFKPVAEDKEDEKFMKHLNGTIEIDKSDGAVLGFSMASLSAFKPHMMVKVKSFRMAATCARAPDGRTYTAHVETNMSGSAAMQSFDEREMQKITKLYKLE